MHGELRETLLRIPGGEGRVRGEGDQLQEAGGGVPGEGRVAEAEGVPKRPAGTNKGSLFVYFPNTVKTRVFFSHGWCRVAIGFLWF